MKTDAARIRPVEPLLLDDHLVVIDKPPRAFVASEGDGNLDARTLIRSPELDADAALTLTPMHRIDEDASGVVVYCRSDLAREALTDAVAAGRAALTYVALVVGYVARAGVIDAPLHYDKKRSRFVKSAARGRPATTDCRIVERLAGHTLLECRPHPDMTDQVRAHLAILGHPAAIDLTYGGGREILLSHFKSGYAPSRRREERPLINRLSLHVSMVTLTHPADGRELCFEAPLPRDLRAAVKQLGRLA